MVSFYLIATLFNYEYTNTSIYIYMMIYDKLDTIHDLKMNSFVIYDKLDTIHNLKMNTFVIYEIYLYGDL